MAAVIHDRMVACDPLRSEIDRRAQDSLIAATFQIAGWRAEVAFLDTMKRQASVPRDVFPPTPPGPEGSNGNGLFRVQWIPGAWLLFGGIGKARYQLI